MDAGSSTKSSPWPLGDHPYRHLPGERFWINSIAERQPELVDPVVSAPFKITRNHKVGTAGSCFAQHISRGLIRHGYGYHQTETAHPLLDGEAALRHGYGIYSARYGNIYTPRQLLQLLQRAEGSFSPVDRAWETEAGVWVDPFRPRAQPGGFASVEELTLDRDQHLAAVRRLFREIDLLVFTLGLTECWLSRVDGAVYPVCPGAAGGRFDPAVHEFVNFEVEEVVEDMIAAVELMRRDNPAMKVLLTVSPVPLMATMEDRSVLASTTHSKAVLRVAADRLVKRVSGAAYFPSYEIVTGPFNRGRYFDEDLRTVTPRGVDHCMRMFLKHFTEEGETEAAQPSADPARQASRDHMARMRNLTEIWCEDEIHGQR